MSFYIGPINGKDRGQADVHVSASQAGVELHAEPVVTLGPAAARNYAALLVRAADEVERMRARGMKQPSRNLDPPPLTKEEYYTASAAGPIKFTEEEYQADPKRVVACALQFGSAEVIRPDGSVRIVISIPPADVQATQNVARALCLCTFCGRYVGWDHDTYVCLCTNVP